MNYLPSSETRKPVYRFTTDADIYASHTGSLITNEGATGPITLTFRGHFPAGIGFTIIDKAQQSINLSFDAGITTNPVVSTTPSKAAIQFYAVADDTFEVHALGA